MYFGKRRGVLSKLMLNGQSVEWTDKWPYLGVTVKSGIKFGCCIAEKVRKFYRATNGILRIDGKPNDMLFLRLIESHCIPILTYGIEVIVVSDANERRQLRVAYNSVFRRIFSYRPWESVRELQTLLSRPTWEDLLKKRVDMFQRKIGDDAFLRGIFTLY